MICRLCELGSEVRRIGRKAAQTANLMVGLPDYDTYVAHRQQTHPGEAVMSRTEFFRERQEARYGGSGRVFRCC